MNFRSSVARRWLAGLAGVAACAMVSACSPGVYPSLFSDPPAREDTPMTSDQVKQVTDDLISDRDHLHSCAEQIATAAPDAAPPDCAAQTTGGVPPGAPAKP